MSFIKDMRNEFRNELKEDGEWSWASVKGSNLAAPWCFDERWIQCNTNSKNQIPKYMIGVASCSQSKVMVLTPMQRDLVTDKLNAEVQPALINRCNKWKVNKRKKKKGGKSTLKQLTTLMPAPKQHPVFVKTYKVEQNFLFCSRCRKPSQKHQKTNPTYADDKKKPNPGTRWIIQRTNLAFGSNASSTGFTAAAECVVCKQKWQEWVDLPVPKHIQK